MKLTTYRPRQTVEATQWDGTAGGAGPIIEWILNTSSQDVSYFESATGPRIVFFDRVQTASPGDFIIKGVLGEFFPQPFDSFDTTYEEIS